MRIKRLIIKNFRNIKDEDLIFSDKFNLFFGKNGEGKTNILEAVFYSGMMKSFRTRVQKDVRMEFNKDYPLFLKCFFEYRNFSRHIEIELNGNKKKLAVDEVEENSNTLLDYNQYVTFVPDDIKIVKKDPVYRRKYINEVCSQIYPEYYSILLKYKKIVHNRNVLLKQGRPFNIWDDLFLKHANYILKKRKIAIDFLKGELPSIYSFLSSGKENISIDYNGLEEITQEDLEKNYIKDKKNGYTGIGPHKDDILIYMQDFDVRKAASQGQLRTAVFSLKMAQAIIIEKVKKELPVLLLDDVFSELDRIRKNNFLDYIGDKYQTFITANDLEDDIINNMKQKEIFFLREGKVEKERIFKTG